jgi:NAD(P)-dependent dehydrogenase (short-subunit alcohol dehydrogenase family)
MLNRFTGNAERKAGLVSSVPLGRVGKPDEIANALVFCDSAWKIDPCRGVIGVQL